MKLDIQHSQDFEIKRVKSTLEKMAWYKEQGYRPRLPEGIDQDSSDDQIKSVVSEEYQVGTYEKTAADILGPFEQIQDSFSQALQGLFDNVPDSITVHITQYGVGGSYNPPNTIVFNYNMSDPLKTILHESVHLMVEPFIQKHSVGHWQKERVVDLILNSEQMSFLNYDSWQRTYHDVEDGVDDLFNKLFFKDPEKFFVQL